MGCLNSKGQTTGGQKPTAGSNGVTGTTGKDGGGTADAEGEKLPLGPGSIQISFYESIGMNTRQIFSLKQSWKGIKRKMEDTGVEMFVRLFKSNEKLKGMFQKFRDISCDDDLRSNEALEFHATMVMTTLDDAITHIDNYDFVTQLLTKVGASHSRFDSFSPDTFMNIETPFLDAVQVTLGDRYTENMERIYKLAINFILKTLMKGLEDELAEMGNATQSSS